MHSVHLYRMLKHLPCLPLKPMLGLLSLHPGQVLGSFFLLNLEQLWGLVPNFVSRLTKFSLHLLP